MAADPCKKIVLKLDQGEGRHPEVKIWRQRQSQIGGLTFEGAVKEFCSKEKFNLQHSLKISYTNPDFPVIPVNITSNTDLREAVTSFFEYEQEPGLPRFVPDLRLKESFVKKDDEPSQPKIRIPMKMPSSFAALGKDLTGPYEKQNVKYKEKRASEGAPAAGDEEGSQEENKEGEDEEAEAEREVEFGARSAQEKAEKEDYAEEESEEDDLSRTSRERKKTKQKQKQKTPAESERHLEDMKSRVLEEFGASASVVNQRRIVSMVCNADVRLGAPYKEPVPLRQVGHAPAMTKAPEESRAITRYVKETASERFPRLKSMLEQSRKSLAGAGLIAEKGVRRSTGSRVRPLQWWRNESYDWERSPDRLPTISRVVLLPPDPIWPRNMAGVQEKGKPGES